MARLGIKALLSISKIDLKKDLKEILVGILTVVGREMGAHSGSIMLVNEETGELETVATYGLTDGDIERAYGKEVTSPSSPAGVALETGRYYLVPDVFEEPRLKHRIDIIRELGFSSQIFMPMKRKSEVIGLLNIFMAEPHKFSESEIAFAAVAANQAAALIENARLYARIRDKNVELEREIRERKQVEEKLKLFSHSVESSVDGFAMGDLNGRITYVNQKFAAMFGYTKEELVGKEIASIYSRDQIPKLERALKTTMKGGWVGELVGKKKNGALFPVAISSSIVLDDKGRIIAHMANHRDITEHKRVEREIRKLSSAVEHSIDGIAVGDMELNLTYVNDAFARMHGYSPKELIGVNVVDLHAAEQEDDYRRCINQVKRKGSWMGEVEHVMKDGTNFPARMLFALLKSDGGKPTGILAVAQDITERKHAEAALFKKGVELKYQINARKQVEEELERTKRECREIAEFLPDLISVLPKLWRSELT